MSDKVQHDEKWAVEGVLPYGEMAHKSDEVEKMFDAIAARYDGFNRWMSLGLDKWWRKRAINATAKRASHAPEKIIDIATGTGDLAIAMARKWAQAEVVGIDLSEEMMQVGVRKVMRAGLKERIAFARQNAEALPYADETFDGVASAFGVRNFEHLEKALGEIGRVVKRGGWLMVVELAVPENPLVRLGWRLHAACMIPLMGRIFARDSRAYAYLPESIAAFPKSEAMREILVRKGFGDVECRAMTWGVCRMYLARKK